MLLERRANVDKADSHGRTPLFFSSRFEFVDLNVYNVFVRMNVVNRYGQSECAMLLIKRGAKLICDHEGVSPIDLCVEVSCTIHALYNHVLFNQGIICYCI